MSDSETQVTVIIPAYNHQEYIETALDSVAAQSHDWLELIVVDDASSDETARIIEGWITNYPDYHCTLIKRQTNGGICAALNDGLLRAEGEICIILASDDWLSPVHVADCVRTFREHPHAVVVYADLVLVDESGNVVDNSYLRRLGFWPPKQGFVYPDLLFNNFVPAPGSAIRTQALRAVGGYDERLSFEDYDMWLRLAPAGEFRWTGRSTVFYRDSPGRMTSPDNLFKLTLQLVTIFDKQAAVAEREFAHLARKRQMWHVKQLYAYSRTRTEKRISRRAIRRVVGRSFSPAMLVIGVAAHLGVSYARLAAIRARIRLTLNR